MLAALTAASAHLFSSMSSAPAEHVHSSKPQGLFKAKVGASRRIVTERHPKGCLRPRWEPPVPLTLTLTVAWRCAR